VLPQIFAALLERRSQSTTEVETWAVQVLYQTVLRLGQALLPHVEIIERVLDRSLVAGSEYELYTAAAWVLGGIIAALTWVYPLSYEGETLHTPSEPEIACAKRLIEKYAGAALSHLDAFAGDWRQARIDLSVLESVLFSAGPLFAHITTDEFRRRIAGTLVQGVLKQLQHDVASPAAALAVKRLPRVIELLVSETKPWEEELFDKKIAYKKLHRVWKTATKEVLPPIPWLRSIKAEIKRLRLSANRPPCYTDDELTGRLISALAWLCTSKELPGLQAASVRVLRTALRCMPRFALRTAETLIERIAANDGSAPADPECAAVASACNALRSTSSMRHRITSRGDLLRQLLLAVTSGAAHEGSRAQVGIFHLVGVCIAEIEPFGSTPFWRSELEEIAAGIVRVSHSRWRSTVIASALYAALLPLFPPSVVSATHVAWLAAGATSEFAPINELSVRTLSVLLRLNPHLGATALAVVNWKTLLGRAVASRTASLAEKEAEESDAVKSIARRFGFRFNGNGDNNGIGMAAEMLARVSSGGFFTQCWPTLPAPSPSTFSESFADLISSLAANEPTAGVILDALSEMRTGGSTTDTIGFQCIEAEVFAGVARNPSAAERQSELGAMLLSALRLATPATVLCWLTAIRYVARHRPSAVPWLHATLAGDVAANNGSSPQRIARLLDGIAELIIESSQEGETVLPMRDLVCSDHAAVRTAAMRLAATLSAASRGRNEAVAAAVVAACNAALASSDNPHGSAVPEFVQHALHKRWPEALRGCYSEVVAALLALRMSRRDADVASAAGRALGLLAVGTRAQYGLWSVDAVLSALERVLQSATHWGTRAAAMPLLEVALHNLGALATPEESLRALQLTVSQLGDVQGDVRDAVVHAMVALLSRAPLAGAAEFATGKLLADFEQLAKSTEPNSKLRGAAGLAALLRAKPHTVPAHVPRIVDALAPLAARSDAAGTTAAQALQSFWASHRRWWDVLWAPLFTPSQVESIRSHSSSSAGSYFA